MSDEKKKEEIQSLTKDWMSFDLEKLTIEQLESRFELSLMILPPVGGEDCTGFSCAGYNPNNCGAFSCGTFNE